MASRLSVCNVCAKVLFPFCFAMKFLFLEVHIQSFLFEYGFLFISLGDVQRTSDSYDDFMTSFWVITIILIVQTVMI